MRVAKNAGAVAAVGAAQGQAIPCRDARAATQPTPAPRRDIPC